MNRKAFIMSYGATCENWTWSWSFVNHEEKIVIFGAWDTNIEDDGTVIFSTDWQTNTDGRRKPAYAQSQEHIRLIENKGYQLKTFPMIFSGKHLDSEGRGPAKIGAFEPQLTSRQLVKKGGNWYATDDVTASRLPEEIANPEDYIEGASKIISVNSYERNPNARKKCVEHYGYVCSVCSFDFEDAYGNIGKNFIHVHHLIPLSEIKKTYKLDPIADLRPVCPNCHAIIHKRQPALKIEDLKKYIKKQKIMKG